MSQDVKQVLADHVDGERERLLALSHRVHGLAETAFEEFDSSKATAAALDERFEVQMGVAGLETAFSASYGTGELVIGICAEYDALPGVGHACGHNIIAAAAVGAGNALAQVADELGITVKVFGTPAEEGGGGKIFMLDAGVFEGVHAAMMVHPAPFELPILSCLAVANLSVEVTGVASHASAFPQRGRNAADALTVSQVAIGLLRQHLPSTARVHGIVTNGGEAPNVVPRRATGSWYVRGEDLAMLAEIEPRVRDCFEAGALATGTTVEVTAAAPHYSEFHHDPDLVEVYAANARAIGRDETLLPDSPPRSSLVDLTASTDMANVSLVIPTIHPTLGLPTTAVNHQAEFAAACITADADRAVRDGALAMARTVVDAAAPGALRDRLMNRTPPSRSQ
ncbi:MAG: amidohydrolase, partial [Glaciecola sp.]